MKIVEFLRKTSDGQLSLIQQKKFLEKNTFPKADDLAKAVNYLQSQMPEVPKLPSAIDICGTGGSCLNRINTSTIASFIVAAAGVPVAKHGNNAASGRFGSFDLLAALDVPINLSAQELQLRFGQCSLAFLYAKNFHPILRHFAAVRSEIDGPTFFNILGPLLSPIKASRQIIGTPNQDNARIIAKVCLKLGKDRVIVVSGQDGLDEITLLGQTHIVELKNGKIFEYDISPSDFGVEPVSNFGQISSKSDKQNIAFAEDILRGLDETRRTDLVLINVSAALYLAGKADDLKAGYDLAKQTLAKGLAYKTLQQYRRPSVLTRIAANDYKRNFAKRPDYDIEINHKVVPYKGGLIAEIKEQSPSEGKLLKNVNYADLAKVYTRSGAKAISVLTEPNAFNGDFYKFARARSATHLPMLMKDFVLRIDHIDKAKAIGADIVLLIVAMLDDSLLARLYAHAKKLGLQTLVEVHNEDELKRALKLKPQIIGVNSRNLHDFSINVDIFAKLARQIPAGVIKIAESGIKNYMDIPSGYDGILVGTEIIKYPFPRLKIKELTGQPLIKLCGIREPGQARLCENLGIDMIGINLVPRSHRCVSAALAKDITFQCTSTITVGVFENQSADEVNALAKKAGVDAIQLSGQEKNLEEYELPVIKIIKPGDKKPIGAFMTIIDGELPGSGKSFDHQKLERFETSLIAGGITPQIAMKLQKQASPLGFDVASGIETNRKIDEKKIKQFAVVFA